MTAIVPFGLGKPLRQHNRTFYKAINRHAHLFATIIDPIFVSVNMIYLPNETKIYTALKCPVGFFHLYNDTKNGCVCFEDNTAYFGNNHRFGAENPQLDRLGCQKSCVVHPECKFWTFKKPTNKGGKGLCYLKTKRANMKYILTEYVSGAKDCQLPNDKVRNI